MSNPARPALLSLAAIGLALVSCQTQPVSVPYATETIEASTAARPIEPSALVSASAAPVDPYGPAPRAGGKWREGQALLQGYFGVGQIQSLDRSGGGLGQATEMQADLDYPSIGGGAQWKLGGNRVDLGLEALMALGWRSNGGAFLVGGGGAAVAVDLSLLIVDFYGGPFISIDLGEKTRVYAGAGPLVQFSNYDQTPRPPVPGTSEGSGSGFGFGLYGRTGIEFQLSPSQFLGFGARWFDSSVNLGSGLGSLDLEGVEGMITYSTRM